MLNKIIYLPILLLWTVACSNNGDSSTPAPEPTSVIAIGLDFARLQTSTPNPFTVTATITKDGQALTGLSSRLQIDLGRGSYDSVTEIADGQYQFTVMPTQTGEYQVTVSYDKTAITRTALVVDEVHSGWGQPMAVSGLVNTAGYEDGITITPDGEYLFVQYGPIYFSGIHLFEIDRSLGGCSGDRLNPTRCDHPWLDTTIGPYTGPERPGFFDGRFDGTTQLHNANSWGIGIEQAPIFAPSTMFYGFKRQPDGTFTEPFYVAFDDDNDALINASGLSFMMNGDGTATILFALDDPSDPDWVDLDGDGIDDVQSLHDIYTTDIVLGQNNSLGSFVYSGTPSTPPVRGTPFPSQLVNFGKTGLDGIAGTQGNPHLFQIDHTVKSIWTDDERDTGGDRGDLAVYELTSGEFPNGSWSKALLPTLINQPWPSGEYQPFFTGSGLYYTHISDTALPEIYYSAYSGGQSNADYQNAAYWSTPEKIMAVNNADAEGKITAIGEPTIANYKGDEYLYFVYGYIRGYDSVSGLPDINMQAGYIKKN